ncbi:NACHT, LRR and PYD domains-containing protein 3-like [Scomber japonicus]|uniref:NACHT, LRR and PYD domains-containing protein 3-like n=1 Tax=Scomber japonicus TaxID=13676 RepID=UPI002304E745|nr:NACHT, LRR and PYD domains-containing protein 3-like [Scomber japonicus]
MIESKVLAIVKTTLKAHKTVIPTKYHKLLDEDEQEDDLPLDDETREAALKIVLYILRDMKKDEHAQTLERSHYGELRLYQQKLKSTIKRKNENLSDEINAQQWPVTFEKIYTNIHLSEGASGGVNNEHEVRRIEAAFNRQKSTEILITCEDIFKPLPKQDTPIRTVLTMGIAGIGKTVLTQKVMLDWSEGKIHQDIELLFSVPFRELNLFRNERLSLMELLCNFSPDLKESGIKELKTYKVLFILDGLDECRFPLDFKRNERCCNATQAASVDVLLTNLIAGNLLPEANLWITTRPAAASCIPPEYVDRVTEIRGFNNLQKEQYFHKKIEDEDLAKRVIANIRSARSLYIMCHVPVFCWISSIVLGNICTKPGGGKMPKTLTQMYIHFLAHQTTRKRVKYSEEQELDSQGNNKMIMTLGKLAFQQLEEGNMIFYEDDLRDCGIDVKEASVHSGVFTQVFREESCMQQKVFCFVHLSVQEFLAALYVHVMYNMSGVNLMIGSEQITQPKSESELHKAAVDKALQSNNGHLDLFLRFLLGLSLESSQDLLKDLKMQVETCDSQSHEETIKYIKERISQTHQPEKYINLFHCLNELNDHSLEEEIHIYMESDQESVMDECSAAQWAALVFVLLTSPKKPEEIQLKKYSRKKEDLLRLLPAIKASKSAMLNDCNLTSNCCKELSSTLSSNSNELNHLNLSDNNLQDSGMELLCTGLKNRHCRLKTLRLNRCSLTQRCCESLASVLSHPSSPLKELDLSDNDIEDSGVQLLCNGLENVNCKLENIRLSFCNITEKGCGSLASAVKSNPSHLRELDLSYNHLGESGVKLISEALEEGRCEFTKLRVDHNAEHWFKPGLKKYSRELTVDTNTVHKLLVLSDGNRKVSKAQEEQPYPDHPERFDYWTQVLFQQGLKGRCYWEVEWEGKWAGMGVTYKNISRKGQDHDCVMGYNEFSWGLHCSTHGYRAYHNCKSIVLHVPLAGFRKLAVYLDWEAGILCFYRVSTGGSLTHLHTFRTKFTEPLYPIFKVWGKGSSVKLLRSTT